MDPSKNHARLVHIFASLARRKPHAHLLLVGRRNREIERQIVDIARQLGVLDNIVIADQRCDVERLVQAADLMLFPSIREGLPGAVLEAASAGLPVLASSLPGIVEIADYFAGVVVLSLQAQDDEWVGSALTLLQGGQEPEFRDAMQVKFRSSPFTIDHATASFTDLWRPHG
jgi:glycosyltransferase involved in cell wall biosynthesis